MLLFQQIRSSPRASPPITGSQLKWENSLLKTQEAVTPYKYLSLKEICHSWGLAPANNNFTHPSEKGTRTYFEKNLTFPLTDMSCCLNSFLSLFLNALYWNRWGTCGHFILSYVFILFEPVRVDFLMTSQKRVIPGWCSLCVFLLPGANCYTLKWPVRSILSVTNSIPSCGGDGNLYVFSSFLFLYECVKLAYFKDLVQLLEHNGWTECEMHELSRIFLF